MLKSHLHLLQNTLKKHNLILHDARILIAISGGPDSVYLAFLLYTLGFDISLAHVNYGLRNLDSQKEEDLVRAYSDKWKVPIYIHKENPKNRMLDSGESLQQIARKIRYSFFDSLIEAHKFDYCALAHHADDQVESILMSLIKGNSSRVIHGMPIKRGPYIRPLIDFHKENILQGLEASNLDFGLDVSNESSVYLRNKIRNQVLPLLEELNPSIRKQLLNRNALYQLQKERIEEDLASLAATQTEELPDGSKSFQWDMLDKTHSATRIQTLMTYVLEQWGWHGNDLWNAVSLIDSMPGKIIEGELGTIYRERSGILYLPLSSQIDKQAVVIITHLEAEKEFTCKGWHLQMDLVEAADFSEENAYFLAYDKLRFPLKFRSPALGDKMTPLGMSNQKKLSDIMIDNKWEKRIKEQALLIEDNEKIVALLGFRISDKVKLGPDDQKILKLSFHR